MEHVIRVENWNFDSRISARSNLSKIKIVYDKLNDEHKEKFKRSCFGNFYKMKDNMKFSGKLLHSLLLRRIRRRRIDSEPGEVENEEELWFGIGNEHLCFSLAEYTLITGLNPGNEEDYRDEIPRQNRLANEYFPRRNKVKPKELENAFKNKAKNEEDKYKLGLVFIYESVLRAKEVDTSIDLETLDIVDDLELFNKYPWGTKSYDFLVKFLVKKMSKLPANTYTLWGFPLALQVWAFEYIPDIVKLFCASMSEDKIPRMCRWKSKYTPHSFEIEELLNAPELELSTQLTATIEETEQEYMQVLFGEPRHGRDIGNVSPPRASMETEGVFPQREETEGVSHGEDMHRSPPPPPPPPPAPAPTNLIPPPQHRPTHHTSLKQVLEAINVLNQSVIALNEKVDALDQKVDALDQKVDIITKQSREQTAMTPGGGIELPPIVEDREGRVPTEGWTTMEGEYMFTPEEVPTEREPTTQMAEGDVVASIGQEGGANAGVGAAVVDGFNLVPNEVIAENELMQQLGGRDASLVEQDNTVFVHQYKRKKKRLVKAKVDDGVLVEGKRIIFPSSFVKSPFETLL